MKMAEFPEEEYCFGGVSSSWRLTDLFQPNFAEYRRCRGAMSAPYRKLTVFDAISDLPKLIEGQRCERYLDQPKTSYQIQKRKDIQEELFDHESYPLTALQQVRVSEIPKSDEIPGANWYFLPNQKIQYCNNFMKTEWTQTLEYKFPLKFRVNGKMGKSICWYAANNRAGKKCEKDGCEYLKNNPSNSLIPKWLAHVANSRVRAHSIKRLNPGSNVHTVTTGIKLGQTLGEIIHPEQDRLITPRECARLMGFADCFSFCGTVEEKHKQIGNAVPPPFAFQLGVAISKSFC